MQHVDFELSPKAFLKKHGARLEAHAAEHNVILSMCQAAERQAARGGQAGMRFVTLFDDGEAVVSAVQMPPHNLVLSRANGDDIRYLVALMAEDNPPFPAIVGPSDVAGAFAEHWAAITGQKTVEYMDQIIYSLRSVHFPEPVDGDFRLATEADAPKIAQWMVAFAKDALPKAEHLSEDEALLKARDRVQQSSIAVWDKEGEIVSQAAVSGTDTVARVNFVYTPPEHRGNGYASAVVARLSQQLLDQGRDMCCLYADARNTVSNAIYRKIGYEFVGRSSLYVLGEKAAVKAALDS
jgi:predicted GNAT family acetyltransferase